MKTFDFLAGLLLFASAANAQTLTITSPPCPSSQNCPLPDAVIGQPYSFQLVASGGTGPYTWSVPIWGYTPGSIHLTLDASGLLHGTPPVGTALGPGTWTFQVSDSAGHLLTATFVLKIVSTAPTQPLTITTTTLPGGTVNANYYPPPGLTASGGTPPYSWKVVNGNLPDGLSLSSGGTISGTPTKAGTFSFTVQVSDSGGSQPVTKAISITINPPAPAALVITTSSLPNGTVNVLYSPAPTLAATGGTLPYSWKVVSGSLPDGLSLSSAGTISGTPTKAGTFSFTVQVSDSVGSQPATKALSITISPAVATVSVVNAVMTNNLPSPFVCSPAPPQVTTFSAAAPSASAFFALDNLKPADLVVANWIDPSGAQYSHSNWNISSSGYSCFASTMTIAGASPASNPGNWKVQILDNGNLLTTLPFSITPALFINPANLPSGTVGVSSNPQTLTAGGGTPPYSNWKITSGNLPYGLSLSSSGSISGTPQKAGTFTFTVQVSDNAGASAQKSFTIQIQPAAAPPLTITTSSPLPDGTVGISYKQPLAATGGTGQYSWSVLDPLPQGLNFSTGGVLSGTPTQAGTYSFRIQVTDSTGTSISKNFTLTIKSPASSTQLKIVTPPSLPNAMVGKLYNTPINAIGGQQPYSWSIPVGDGIPFLKLDSNTGRLSGTPTADIAGQTFQFHVVVTDPAGDQDVKLFRLLVVGASTIPLSITTADPLSDGYRGLYYATQLAATGGAVPYTWSVIDESDLPPGLLIDPTRGQLYGVPSATGNFSFTLQVADSVGARVQQLFHLKITVNDHVIPAGPVPPVMSPVRVVVDGGRAYFVDRSNYDVYSMAFGYSDAVSVVDLGSGTIQSAIFVGSGVGDTQSIAIDSHRRRLYVPNANDNTVTVINPDKGEVIDTIFVGSTPTGVGVDPRTGNVYVALSGDQTVTLLDANGGNQGTVSVGATPLSIAVDPNSGRAYVATEPPAIVALDGLTKSGSVALGAVGSIRGIAVDPGSHVYAATSSGQVYIADFSGSTPALTGSFTAGDGLASIAVDPNTHNVYVTNFDNSQVNVYSSSGGVLNPYNVSQGPIGIAIDSAGQRAVVADFLATGFSIIDLNQQTVLNSAPVATFNTALAFDRDTKRIYGANFRGNSVSVIDPQANKATQSWTAGQGPWELAADPGVKQVYVVDANEGTVAILSTTDDSLKAKIPFPNASNPFIAVNSTNHRVYVTQGDPTSSQVMIIDGTSNSIVTQAEVGPTAMGIAVDEIHGLVYVGSLGAGTITILDATDGGFQGQFQFPESGMRALAIDPGRNQLYVTVPPDDSGYCNDFCGVKVLNTQSGNVVGSIDFTADIDTEPDNVMVNPTTGHVFVADAGNNVVKVADGDSFAVLKAIPSGNWPFAMTLDPDSSKIYIPNMYDGTLNIINDPADITGTPAGSNKVEARQRRAAGRKRGRMSPSLFGAVRARAQ